MGTHLFVHHTDICWSSFFTATTQLRRLRKKLGLIHLKSTTRVPRTSNDGNVFAIARSSTFQDNFDIYHASVSTEELALRNHCKLELHPRKESCSATGADVDACAGCSASPATLEYANPKPSSPRPSQHDHGQGSWCQRRLKKIPWRRYELGLDAQALGFQQRQSLLICAKSYNLILPSMGHRRSTTPCTSCESFTQSTRSGPAPTSAPHAYACIHNP